MKDHYIPEDRFPMKITDRIFVLGNYFINLFLIIGEKKSALFEAGISGVVDAAIRQMDQLNVRPDYIIPSHPHSDHITGLPGLVDRYPDAAVITATGAGAFIGHPKAGPLMLKEDAHMSQGLRRFGIDPGRKPLARTPDLSAAREIDQQTRLALGGISLDLIPAEGHSPGNLIAWAGEEKTIFCADNLGFHFPGRRFLPLFFTGVVPYLATLRMIKNLSPEIICPAHQGPLAGERCRQGIQSSLEATCELIRRIQESSMPAGKISDRMFKESYRDEFTLYTAGNIKQCNDLLIRRAKEAGNLELE